jgi:hypothetical protein
VPVVRGYPIRTANMAGTAVADLNDPPANCAKLAAPPMRLTMSPGPVDPCPSDPRTLNYSRGVIAPKVLWDSQALALTILFNKFDPPVIDGS